MSQDKIELTLEPRTVIGKQVRQLRNQGIVPAVIHDHGKESVLVQGDLSVMLKTYKQAGKHHPVSLSASGKKYTAMIKTIEFEPQKQALNHVVFNAVSAHEKVEADIPVRARYAEGNESSPAERSGYIVLTNLSTVQVAAISSKLPDVIEYDAESLVEIGDNITVEDLIAPEGVEILTDVSQMIAAVHDPGAVAAANDAAGGDAEAGEEATAEQGDSLAEENTDEPAADKKDSEAKS